MKVEVKKNPKKYNEFTVKMVLTEGAILAIKHSLEANTRSAVAQDVVEVLKAAGTEAGIKW
jgi:hypothetical protein